MLQSLRKEAEMMSKVGGWRAARGALGFFLVGSCLWDVELLMLM